MYQPAYAAGCAPEWAETEWLVEGQDSVGYEHGETQGEAGVYTAPGVKLLRLVSRLKHVPVQEAALEFAIEELPNGLAGPLDPWARRGSGRFASE